MATRASIVLLLFFTVGTLADWQASLQKAFSIHQGGDLQGACKYYKEALNGNPELRKHPGVLTNYALSIQAEAPAEAADAFREVIKMTPNSPDAYYNLGHALTDCGDLAAAEEALGSCLKLNPEDADAHYDLSTCLLRQQKYEAATTSIRASIALQPADAKAYVALGDGLAASREWTDSRTAYKQACELRPSHMNSWVSLGNAEEECGLLADAEQSWGRAIKLGEAQLRSSMAAEDDGFFDEDGEVDGEEDGEGGSRSSTSDDTESLKSDLSGVYQNLGALLRRMDRQPEGRKAYASALKLDPTSVEAYMGMGRAGAAPKEGFKDGNRAYLKYLQDTYGNALKLQPNLAGAYTAIGEGMRMYGLEGGCEEFDGLGALEMYQAALKIVPTNTLALTHVAYGSREPCSEEANERLMCADALSADGVEEEGDDDKEGAIPTIESLSAPLPHDADKLNEALAKWRRNGLAVFPSLLSADRVKALLAHVRAAQHGNYTADYTAVTRDKNSRSHKALPVGEAKEALESIANSLQPFFEAALGTSAPALLESGFMVTGPGAMAQNFHRDVAPAVVSRSSIAVSVQVSLVDTAPTQGCLEVIPRSQAFSTEVSDKERQEKMPHVKVAVPAGTVTVYALHTMHRGTANTHTDDRPFYFFTLVGEGLAPPGLAYTIQPDDVGRWQLAEGAVQERA